MKRNLFLMIFFLLSPKLFAIDQESLKKYPYQLLTNDYGILNEANLKRYADDMIVAPFTGKFSHLDYWQCFPTKNVTVWYEKGEYDPYDKTTYSSPSILVTVNATTTYEYVLRRAFPVDYHKIILMLGRASLGANLH